MPSPGPTDAARDISALVIILFRPIIVCAVGARVRARVYGRKAGNFATLPEAAVSLGIPANGRLQT